MFALVTPNVYAESSNIGNNVNQETGQSLDTKYQTALYEEPIEHFDLDIEWDDLNWMFVYEGDVSNPSRSKWMHIDQYNNNLTNQFGSSPTESQINEWNKSILDGNWSNSAYTQIWFANNSGFAIDALCEVVQKSNNNYTTSAGLKMVYAIGANQFNDDYTTSKNVTSINNSETVYFRIKPTATRFVNDTGDTANVTGEIKLTFTKSN